jgi:hypothetical protein
LRTTTRTNFGRFGRLKFDFAVLTHAAFDEFCSPFRRLEYAIVYADRSEFVEQMPALAAFQASFGLTMPQQKSAELEKNSIDDTTLLQHGLTLFWSILPAQRE